MGVLVAWPVDRVAAVYLRWRADASGMTAYYNENDPFAAAWLRSLIAAGHIMAGDVDERSIRLRMLYGHRKGCGFLGRVYMFGHFRSFRLGLILDYSSRPPIGGARGELMVTRFRTRLSGLPCDSSAGHPGSAMRAAFMCLARNSLRDQQHTPRAQQVFPCRPFSTNLGWPRTTADPPR